MKHITVGPMIQQSLLAPLRTLPALVRGQHVLALNPPLIRCMSLGVAVVKEPLLCGKILKDTKNSSTGSRNFHAITVRSYSGERNKKSRMSGTAWWDLEVEVSSSLDEHWVCSDWFRLDPFTLGQFTAGHGCVMSLWVQLRARHSFGAAGSKIRTFMTWCFCNASVLALHRLNLHSFLPSREHIINCAFATP